MDIFLESPWPAIVLGIFGEAVLAVMLVRTGRGVLLWAMIGVLALALLGVGVERLVVTDNKLITAVLYDTAAALEANDLNRVLAHVAADADKTRADARSALSEAEITELKIRYLEIKINRLTSPPSAGPPSTSSLPADTGAATMGREGASENSLSTCAATRAAGSSPATS